MGTGRGLQRIVRAWATGALLAVAVAGCAGDRPTAATPASSYRFPVREYAFPSGLRVVIEQDDTVPIAGAVLVVEAGILDDPADKNGLAHTSEHLFVMAPAEHGASLWKTMPRLGAKWFNAGTGAARTTYYAFAPRSSLDELVGALMARMADPARGIDDAMVAKELLIVAEEMRMRRDLSAHPRALAAVMPPDTPIARALAQLDRLDALTLGDVKAFADRVYRPERMTLVITGAIGADWDERLKTLLPQRLRGDAADRRPAIRRPPSVAAALPPVDDRIATMKASVAGPELWMAWPLPATKDLEHLRLPVMARVADRLVSDSLDRTPSAVIDVDAYVVGDNQASAFVCRARLRSADDADRARDEVGKLLEQLSGVRLPFGRELGPTYRRIVREAALNAAIGMEHPVTRALTRAGIVHRAPGTQISQIIATLQNIDADELAAFAEQHVKPGGARSALLVPADAAAADSAAASGRLQAASMPAEMGGGAEPDIRFADDGGDDGVDLGGPGLAASAWAPGAHRARVTTLANGLTVIAMRRPGLPFVSMVLGFHGEPRGGEAPGVRAAVLRTQIWNLRSEPIERGIVHATTLTDDSYRETLNLFSADAPNALQLIAEQPGALRVHWPSANFKRWLDGEAQTDAAPEQRARRGFRTTLFGEHPYRLAPALDAVRTVTGDDLKAWLQHSRRPKNGALVIVGDIDVEDISRRAERLLGSWAGDEGPLPPLPDPPQVRRIGPRPKVLFTEDARRRSTAVRFGCVLPPIRTMAADVRSDVLVRMFEHDLLRRLRLKLGASYAPDVGASTLRGGTAVLEGSLDVADAALPDALDMLRDWLDPGRPTPVKPAAFERQRRDMARRSAFHGSSNGHVAGLLFYAWNLGWPLAEVDALPDALARMTVGEVTADLETCRATAVISVVGKNAPP